MKRSTTVQALADALTAGDTRVIAARTNDLVGSSTDRAATIRDCSRLAAAIRDHDDELAGQIMGELSDDD